MTPAQSPDKGNHRVALLTVLFSAIIIFLALYSSTFEFAVREVKNTAVALFRSANVQQFAVSESANLFAQTPSFRRRSVPDTGSTLDRGVIEVADSPAEPNVVLVPENAQAGRIGAADDKGEDVANLVELDPFDVDTDTVIVETIDTEEKIFLVRFGFDSAELDENSLTTIQRAIDAIQDRYEGVAIVAGYSDPFGNAAYNLKLSRKRAQAVADFLLASGVSGDRLRVEGRGAYAALGVKASQEPLELGRIAQIIIEESSEW